MTTRTHIHTYTHTQICHVETVVFLPTEGRQSQSKKRNKQQNVHSVVLQPYWLVINLAILRCSRNNLEFFKFYHLPSRMKTKDKMKISPGKKENYQWGDNYSIFILVFNQLDAQNVFYKFYFTPLHVSSTCAHHQEVKIALNSLWYHRTL